MAAPSFGDMLQRQNLNKSTRELVATLNQARAKAALERRNITVELLSADVDTEDTLNWMPVGKSSLKTGRATEIVFMPTGLVRDPVADQIITTDTSFEICDASSDPKYSKMVTISKMGTIQQIVDGDCT